MHFKHPSAGSTPFMTSQRIQMPLQGEKLYKEEVLADQSGATSFLYTYKSQGFDWRL